MDQASQPKRRNAPLTKARILAAAQEAFSRSGYSQTGIRDIADMVGVSSTILLRYFGSKAGLFEAALLDLMHLDVMMPEDRSQFGRRVADLLVHPKLNISPHAMSVTDRAPALRREGRRQEDRPRPHPAEGRFF